MSERTMTRSDRHDQPDAGSAPNSPVSTRQKDHVRRSRWWPIVVVIGLGLLGWAWQSANRNTSGSADEASVLGTTATPKRKVGVARPESSKGVGDPKPRPSLRSGRATQPVSGDNGAPSAGEPTDRDELYRQRLVGRWETERSGKRVLTVRDDGTATMVVEPDGAWTYLFGSRLTFEVEWTIEDKELIYEATGGTPENKIKLVTEMWGNQRRQAIRELTEDRLILIDEDGGPDHDWKRVESGVRDETTSDEGHGR